MSSTPMISANWATLLEPGLRAAFMLQMDAGAVGGQGVFALYNRATSNRSKEETLGVGGLADIPEYDGAIEYDVFDMQYKRTFEHKEYARGIAVERKLIDDDQYNVIVTRTRQLAMAFDRTRRKSAANTFNNAFASSTNTGDGVALCAANHPTSKQRGGTQSNRGTTALSYDAVVDTRVLMMNFKDDRGQIVNVNPDTLIVPLNLEATAWTIVNSMQRPGTANNDANFNRAIGWNVVVDRYLTDSNNWFMVDSAMARMHLWWFDRVPVEFSVDPSSDFDLVARFRGYMRYSYGADNWRWIYGHEVTGS